MQTASTTRPARIDDAAVLAELVNDAGEGLPLYLWGKLASAGETVNAGVKFHRRAGAKIHQS